MSISGLIVCDAEVAEVVLLSLVLRGSSLNGTTTIGQPFPLCCGFSAL